MVGTERGRTIPLADMSPIRHSIIGAHLI